MVTTMNQPYSLPIFEEKVLLPIFKLIVSKQIQIEQIFQYLPNSLLYGITKYPPEILSIYNKLYLKFISDIQNMASTTSCEAMKFNTIVIFLLFHHTAYVQAYIWLYNFLDNDEDASSLVKELQEIHKFKLNKNGIGNIPQYTNELLKNLKEQVISAVLIKRYGQYRFVLEKLRKLLLHLHLDKLEPNYMKDKRRNLLDLFILLSNELECTNLKSTLLQQLNESVKATGDNVIKSESSTKKPHEHTGPSRSSEVSVSLSSTASTSSISLPLFPNNSASIISHSQINNQFESVSHLSNQNSSSNRSMNQYHFPIGGSFPTQSITTQQPIGNYLLPMQFVPFSVPTVVSGLPTVPSFLTWLPTLSVSYVAPFSPLHTIHSNQVLYNLSGCPVLFLPHVASLHMPSHYIDYRQLLPNHVLALCFRALARLLHLPVSGFEPRRFGAHIEFYQWSHHVTKDSDPSAHCPICFATFTSSEVVSELSCKHIIHFYCLKRWKSTCAEREVTWTCPLCRRVLEQ